MERGPGRLRLSTSFGRGTAGARQEAESGQRRVGGELQRKRACVLDPRDARGIWGLLRPCAPGDGAKPLKKTHFFNNGESGPTWGRL